jgi:predicted RNA binding protein YcfA (HicA-like mRNA interferase family)
MNQRLPALTARDVIRVLERAGFEVSRSSGSHCPLIHVREPTRKVTVPVHSGDLKRGTLRAIIAQAGMTVADFLALLSPRASRVVCSAPTQRNAQIS